MTLIRHELRQARRALAVWTASIGLLIAVCVFMFPEMKKEMESMNRLFASLGAFTAAFGMDKLNFGTLIGFYAVECGNILGIGGAFFAALAGINALAKEEGERTAEFLLTHPVSRSWIVRQKLAAAFLQVLILNACVFALSAASIAAIGEAVPWRDLGLLHLAYLLLQLELTCVCFGLSAFLRRGNPGLGIGLAAVMYFLNLLSNISESARFLEFITPFAYAEGADILSNSALDLKLIAIGTAFAAAGIIAAFARYMTKDIH